MAKISVTSPANIAFIKYWGILDETQTLPRNVSLSMTLSQCVAHCTMETLDAGESDDIWWRETPQSPLIPAPESVAIGIRMHLAQLRKVCQHSTPVRIATGNCFPTGAGIASSAAGFSALALAAAHLWAEDPTPQHLAWLARLSGSGSAARSALGGYVAWPGDDENPDSPPRQIASAAHWELHDSIAIVDAGHKEVGSREGHRRAPGSPYYAQRQRQLPARLREVETAIQDRNFSQLATAVETEAIDLHLIAMSSVPPVFYWRPATLAVLDTVRQLRQRDIPACATLDAGPNVHVIHPASSAIQVREALESIPGVIQVITDHVGDGPRLSNEHWL